LARPAGADPLAVIVHGARADRPSRDEIAQIYLKQRRFWADGERIVPVNRESESRAREAFVSRILGTTARQLVVYWNRQYFQGVLPPATLASDEAVRRFVASEKRAIGYVHPGTVDGSVRVVLQLD
jgi:ABC-type phosphate transport system substrate-binding protein